MLRNIQAPVEWQDISTLPVYKNANYAVEIGG